MHIYIYKLYRYSFFVLCMCAHVYMPRLAREGQKSSSSTLWVLGLCCPEETGISLHIPRRRSEMLWSFAQCPGSQTWEEVSPEILCNKCMVCCKAVCLFGTSIFGRQIVTPGKIHHPLRLSWAPESERDLISSGSYSGASLSKQNGDWGTADSSRVPWALGSPRAPFLVTWSA